MTIREKYDIINKGIKLMQESPVIKIVQVTTVANKKNLDELEDLYNLLVENGVKYWRVVNCDPIGRALDNDGILLDHEDFKFLFDFIKEKNNDGKMTEVTLILGRFEIMFCTMNSFISPLLLRVCIVSTPLFKSILTLS